MAEKKTAETKDVKTKDPVYTKWWFWVIIGVICLGVLSSSSGSKSNTGTDGNSSSSSQTSDTSSNSSAKNPEDRVYAIGESVDYHDFKVSVDSIQRNYSLKYSSPESGKEYVKVVVTMKNISNGEASYSIGDWKMEDKNGELNTYKITVSEENGLSYGKLTAGGTKTGSIIFEVPKGDDALKLHYYWNMFSDKSIVFKV